MTILTLTTASAAIAAGELDPAGLERPLADRQPDRHAEQVGVVELHAGAFLAVVVEHVDPGRL